MRGRLRARWFIGHVTSCVGQADRGTGAKFGKHVVQPFPALLGQQFLAESFAGGLVCLQNFRLQGLTFTR